MLTKTPGTAERRVLFKVLTVYSATYLQLVLSLHCLPFVVMFGFNTIPSRQTPYSYKALIVAEKTLSDTFAHTSMLWSPSIVHSGSTIGTSPLS